MSRRPSVIIVGGGFGGLCAAQALKSAPRLITGNAATDFNFNKDLASVAKKPADSDKVGGEFLSHRQGRNNASRSR